MRAKCVRREGVVERGHHYKKDGAREGLGHHAGTEMLTHFWLASELSPKALQFNGLK